jgi:hypothetical protein
MEEQLIFKFTKKEPIKGYPELHWKGKRPYTIDPLSNRLRKYYPDFLAKMSNGTYLIVEVKGDNKMEDEVVKVKERAAKEVAAESSMTYEILPGSKIMSEPVI